MSVTRSGEVQARLPRRRGQEEGDGGELQQRHEPRQRRRGPQRAGRWPRPQRRRREPGGDARGAAAAGPRRGSDAARVEVTRGGPPRPSRPWTAGPLARTGKLGPGQQSRAQAWASLAPAAASGAGELGPGQPPRARARARTRAPASGRGELRPGRRGRAPPGGARSRDMRSS